MPAPTLVMQTAYAELLERCANAAFAEAFAEAGSFVPKTIKGRRYWYFQTSGAEGRRQKYVGLETPELLEKIERHREARHDERERSALVSTLVRSFGFPRPIPEIGGIIAALAEAGIFRLRGVLVGTAAYQTYSAMLGTKLPHALLQTGDVDIAQFKNVSVAVEDRTPPVADVLKSVDKTFRAVPIIAAGTKSTHYVAKGGFRVDFLTPNEGGDTGDPQPLPAFQTDAQPLRFLDFLIHEPEPAVVLHGDGVHVLVPSPQRYAVHKLIVSRLRRVGAAKSGKDIRQAEALIEALGEKRPRELKSVYEEADGRGPKWRQLLMEGADGLAPRVRDILHRTIGRTA
ncbi:MAG: nucleotidyltransferase family protein [Rhodospirillales bacterium]